MHEHKDKTGMKLLCAETCAYLKYTTNVVLSYRSVGIGSIVFCTGQSPIEWLKQRGGSASVVASGVFVYCRAVVKTTFVESKTRVQRDSSPSQDPDRKKRILFETTCLFFCFFASFA